MSDFTRVITAHPGDTLTIECETVSWVVGFSRHCKQLYDTTATDAEKIMLYSLSHLGAGDVAAVRKANAQYHSAVSVAEFRVWLARFMGECIKESIDTGAEKR